MEIPSSALLLHSSIVEDPLTSMRGSSGISISKNWILTHGTALSSIVNKSHALSTFLTNITAGELTIVPKTLASQLKFRVYRDPSVDSNGRPKILEHIGGVAAAWTCPLLKKTFDDFFETWNFSKSSDYDDRFLRSMFLLVRVELDVSIVEIPAIEQELSCLLSHALRNPTRGSFVEIESTPLGYPVFIGSIARGVISNVVGDDGCVIMTDAHAFPGGEGGPIYVIPPDCKRRIISAMVIAPLSWCREEWVDYTFGANLAPCLISILEKNASRLRPSITDRENANEALDRSVVLVRSGISWGTGVLIDKDTGTFLTCSHVVSEAPEREISIVMGTNNSNSRVRAKLVYRTSENQPYDVAVLRVNPRDVDPSLRSVRLTDTPIVKGEPVISVGFPFSSRIRPTVSSGVISKSMDCALLTTCCSPSGTSGGPIISRITGEMLGMVVCTALSMDGTVVYPRISLAVPVTALSEPLREYLRTDNPDVLQALTCNDAIVRKIWNFYPYLPSKL
ncbi:peroxisomal leader peptide-processing protease-like [Pseudomyrmex gracilis]|uniref:peroxisomal leader peptide-processing protease-like n=1 Tax=Pseudomyrmex gracilis TaxID=219809 RepID=UPI0009950354|nr:peroxisomal leader peptide-processing protease-like [Pseudomyrmex gracilis]XP_020287500.1 peroxisomal leader peptide-processing protease-like [Pseudomyrmex gracilis]XP_020287502.1 peroxisomal leader peptide-processing protease-like [Pseudomyrmex gracilis]